MTEPATPRPNAMRVAWFVLSAGAAAALLRFAWSEPLIVGAGLLAVGVALGVRWVARRRVKRLLQSGDVESVLARWTQALERVPHASTMGPLMAATAFAAYGWVARAREVLRAAERGPAWEAALEHRLFLDTILLTFEGDSDAALAQAERLRQLPMPASLPQLAERVQMLRSAVAALARAFAHRGQRGDRQLLLTASDASPLVHWAMRYAAAVLAVDDGDLGGARALLADAPAWPAESRFRGFHAEIAGELERLAVAPRPGSEAGAARVAADGVAAPDGADHGGAASGDAPAVATSEASSPAQTEPTHPLPVDERDRS
ncbi:MAG: hypothetical protein IT373_01195 [Polyangiaceae bacterium]|nr:hypothetical protein [Polyangiaceae bacterium]